MGSRDFTVSHLNVEKRFVVERLLAPNLSRGFILERQLCNRKLLDLKSNDVQQKPFLFGLKGR